MKNNVNKLRLEKGLTQKELAKKLEVSRATVINIESNRCKGISDENLKKISAFFETTPFKTLGLKNFRYQPKNVEEIEWFIDLLNKEKEKWLKKE